MLETAAVALATFFATVGPIDVAAAFTALTAQMSSTERRSIAFRGSVVAGTILLAFALIGERLLGLLGISLPALRTAGGILLLLISIDMIFARSSGATSTTVEEAKEAKRRHDIAIFPLATPLIAGPGAIGASILLMTHAQGRFTHQAIVIACMLVILFGTWLAMLAAIPINRILGITGMQVISRVFGILLAALAVQFIFDGITQHFLMNK